MYNWRIDYSITPSIKWCDSKYNRQYEIDLPFSRVFFWRKLCLVSLFLVCSLSCGKNTSWITLNQLTIWGSQQTFCWVDGTSSYHWQNNIRMYIFTDETFFANGVSINFLFLIPVFFSFFLGIFYSSTPWLFNFNLSTSSLLINFNITYHTWFPFPSSLESSDNFHLLSKFLAVSCLFLDDLNVGYRV